MNKEENVIQRIINKMEVLNISIGKINKNNSLILLVIGHGLLISVFLMDFLEKNSESLLKVLITYLGKLSTTVVTMLLFSIAFISICKYIMRINGTISFLDKLPNVILRKIDIFVGILSVFSILAFPALKYSFKYKFKPLLEILIKLVENQFVLMCLALLLTFYIIFILMGLIETIFIFLVAIVNKVNRDLETPIEKYTLLLGFFGIIISVITILK